MDKYLNPNPFYTTLLMKITHRKFKCIVSDHFYYGGNANSNKKIFMVKEIT